jgi:hypothetical protein
MIKNVGSMELSLALMLIVIIRTISILIRLANAVAHIAVNAKRS